MVARWGAMAFGRSHAWALAAVVLFACQGGAQSVPGVAAPGASGAAMAAPPPARGGDVPTWRVGDVWEYTVTWPGAPADTRPPAAKAVVEVVGVQRVNGVLAHVVRERIPAGGSNPDMHNERTRYYDVSNLNELHECGSYRGIGKCLERYKEIDFPLRGGKSWSMSSGGDVVVEMGVTVDHLRSAELPPAAGGRGEAFRITTAPSLGRWRHIDTYAPGVGNYVERILDHGDGTIGERWILADYRPGGRQSSVPTPWTFLCGADSCHAPAEVCVKGGCRPRANVAFQDIVSDCDDRSDCAAGEACCILQPNESSSGRCRPASCDSDHRCVMGGDGAQCPAGLVCTPVPGDDERLGRCAEAAPHTRCDSAGVCTGAANVCLWRAGKGAKCATAEEVRKAADENAKVTSDRPWVPLECTGRSDCGQGRACCWHQEQGSTSQCNARCDGWILCDTDADCPVVDRQQTRCKTIHSANQLPPWAKGCQ